MTLFFGICFILHFLKLSAGHGFIDNLNTSKILLYILAFYKLLIGGLERDWRISPPNEWGGDR